MSPDDCTLAIKVVPNASKTEVTGWLGDSLKIRLQATPQDGKADKALKVERQQILLESGQFFRKNEYKLSGLTALKF